MALYNITNNAKGARGFNSVFVDAGQTLTAVELSDDEVLILGELDGLEVQEVKAEKLKPEKPTSKE